MANDTSTTIDLIDDYLSCKGYNHLSSEFQAAVAESEQNGETEDRGSYILSEFLQSFSTGNHVDLFILWQNHIPRSLLRLNSESTPEHQSAMQLEFYLNLHCAVYPFRDEVLRRAKSLEEVTTACGKSMSVFRRYIESRGKTLSQTPEFIAFYALPYVPNPTEHPTFSLMFTQGWMDDLKLKLVHFVRKQIENEETQAQPKIYKIVKDAKRNREMEGRVKESRMREKTIVKFAESIYNVSLELWDSLKRKGGSNEGEEFLEEVGEQLKRFQDTFDQLSQRDVSSPRNNNNSNSLNQPHVSNNNNNNTYSSSSSAPPPKEEYYPPLDQQISPRGHREIVSKISSLAQLDIKLIKKDLENLAVSGSTECAILLQALRWRFARAPSHQIRQSVLGSYIRNDILGITSGHVNHSKRAPLFAVLLTNGGPIVAEYTARFINCMATMSRARDYIMSNHSQCITSLCDVLRTDESDSVTRQQVLGSLQKCSLRRSAQLEMINQGVIEWTLSVLEQHNGGNQLCDYSLEYCTALLMNLCLRTIGKQTCPDTVFNALLPLLQHDNQQVRHYINGTIYSLLSMPSHRTTAIDMKLDTVLRNASSKASPAFRRQYTFMLDLLISSSEGPQSDDDESDVEVDESEIVPETVEEREDVTSDLVGEGLLCQQYLIIDVSQARREGEADEAKISHDDLPIGRQHSNDSGAVLRRAVTPSMMQRPDPHAQEMSEEELKAVEELRELQMKQNKAQEKPSKRGGGMLRMNVEEQYGEDEEEEEEEEEEDYDEEFSDKETI
ncbi:hypothetical protein TL16_g03051 [Triparma laevis f. inornata]|uniref:LisH domain-containing protein ARMC9 n=1 Tax=Triparma laevis f. inornata TaxID=1714386 RepID=A0A9W7DXS9_9STRA|nr:hypothetical protein TL16_g03051 [Triparma laevis f. inornata]